MKRLAVVFLQNAWHPNESFADREEWLRALGNSRSGQRLRILERYTNGVELYFENTTPVVGSHPDSAPKANLTHMMAVVTSKSPNYAVCMGNQAKDAWNEIRSLRSLRGKFHFVHTIPTLFLPHPAYRVVTNELFFQAETILEEGFQGDVELIQRKGFIQRIAGK